MKRLALEIYHKAVPLFLLSSKTIPVKAIVSQSKMIYKPFLTSLDGKIFQYYNISGIWPHEIIDYS